MHQTRKITIAEDDPHLCRYLFVLLDQRNCEIAVEHNVEDVIRRAAFFQPDVALIGFMGMDGSTTRVGPLKARERNVCLFQCLMWELWVGPSYQ
jgi:DNA-binding response OmpR family regulator